MNNAIFQTNQQINLYYRRLFDQFFYKNNFIGKKGYFAFIILTSIIWGIILADQSPNRVHTQLLDLFIISFLLGSGITAVPIFIF